jgi:hypothetical protein
MTFTRDELEAAFRDHQDEVERFAGQAWLRALAR